LQEHVVGRTGVAVVLVLPPDARLGSQRASERTLAVALGGQRLARVAFGFARDDQLCLGSTLRLQQRHVHEANGLDDTRIDRVATHRAAQLLGRRLAASREFDHPVLSFGPACRRPRCLGGDTNHVQLRLRAQHLQ